MLMFAATLSKSRTKSPKTSTTSVPPKGPAPSPNCFPTWLTARDFTTAFQSVDAIIAPVSPFPAFRIGEKVDDPVAMYLSDIYTITGSLAGIPCMSVPCGTTTEGLPVGLQILCDHFREPDMFRLAEAFEATQALQ